MADDPAVSLWAEDECYFKLHGSSIRVWAPKGERPTQIFRPGREKIGYFGATDLDTGEMEFQRADSFKAEDFLQFLKTMLNTTS